ncbi:MAG: peptidylprolyl isomerase [Dehalococcoidia bacterium]
MPKKRRQAKIPTPAWERPRGTIGSRVMGRGFQFYGAVVVGMLIIVALGIIGYAFLNDELEKRARPGSTAVQIEDTRFRVDYFASRLKIYVDQNGGAGVVQPISAVPAVSSLLTQEEIVRRFAGEFDAVATDEEITEETANRLGITSDDESFDVVFQQELARSGLSEPDYSDMIEAVVLRDKLSERFAAEVPKSAESVHYRQILVSEQATADDIQQQVEGVADFAALAAESSLDVATKDDGGDVGWVPRGVQDASMEELLFALDVGGITTIPVPSGVLIIEMLEKDDDHAVEEDQIQPLADRAFADWAQEKMESLTIVDDMDLGEGDPKKIQWAIDRAYQS